MCIDLNNKNDRDMLKEIVTDTLISQLQPINQDVSDMKKDVSIIMKKTSETNGKVMKHESILNTLVTGAELHTQSHEAYMESRGFSCPHSQDIKDLKQSKLFGLKTKQLVIGFFSFLVLIAGLTLSLLRINEQFEDKKYEKILDMLQEKIEQNDT